VHPSFDVLERWGVDLAPLAKELALTAECPADAPHGPFEGGARLVDLPPWSTYSHVRGATCCVLSALGVSEADLEHLAEVARLLGEAEEVISRGDLLELLRFPTAVFPECALAPGLDERFEAAVKSALELDRERVVAALTRYLGDASADELAAGPLCALEPIGLDDATTLLGALHPRVGPLVLVPRGVAQALDERFEGILERSTHVLTEEDTDEVVETAAILVSDGAWVCDAFVTARALS
jgi:hypothetical protein